MFSQILARPARWALGSVADQVARHAGAAVLLVRAGGATAEPLTVGERSAREPALRQDNPQ